MISIHSRYQHRPGWSMRSEGTCVHPRHRSSREDNGVGELSRLYPLIPEQFLISEGTKCLRCAGCCAHRDCFMHVSKGCSAQQWRWQWWGRCRCRSPRPPPAPCPWPCALQSDATQHLHTSRSCQGLCIAASRFSREANLKSLESFSEASPCP